MTALKAIAFIYNECHNMVVSVAKGVVSVTTNCHDVLWLVLHHPVKSGIVDMSWQIVLKKEVPDVRQRQDKTFRR